MHKKRRFGVLAAAVLGALSSYNSAKAITFTWQGPGDDSANPSSGNWASPSFWGGGELPFVPDQSEYYTNRASTELVFGGGNQNRAYTTWDDYNTGVPGELNILRFNSTSTATNTLTTVNPNTGFDFGTSLRFVNNGTTTPRITQDSGGSFDILIPLIFDNGTTNASGISFTGNGTGRVNFKSTLTFAATPMSFTLSGAMTLDLGSLSFGSAATPQGALTISNGTLMSTGTFTPSGTTVSGGTSNVVIAGAGALTKNGNGTHTLAQADTYAGATNIQGGTLNVNGNGRVVSTSALNIGNGGAFGTIHLDNTASNLDRMRDGANVTFSTQGGGLNYTGNATSSTETVGSLTLTGGANRIQVTSPTGATTTLAFTGGLTRGASVAAVDFVGAGGTLGAGATGPRVTFSTAPALANGIIGGWATVNGADFAAYDATNGVVAYTGYTDLPTSGFSNTTNYQATGNVTLAGGGNVYTLKLNPAAAQTLDLGANTLTLDARGLIKTGAGTTTVNGTGSLASSTEMTIMVGQGTLVLNAPLATPRLIKAGAGTLNFNLGATAPTWMGAQSNITGTVGLNLSSDLTPAGAISGSGGLVKTGAGKLTLTNAANSYTGGTVINGGTVELRGTTSTTSVTINNGTGNGVLGYNNAAGITINGATLKVTPSLNATGTVAGSINLGRAITFGANGGLLDLTNTVGGTIGGSSTNVAGVTVGGGGGDIPLTTTTGATAPAVIRFNGGQGQFSDPAAPRNWNAGGNVLRFNALNGTAPVRVELSNAGTVRPGNGGGGTQNISVPFTVAGTPLAANGDSSSGPAGLNDPGLITTTGHIAIDNANIINHQRGLFLEGALQVAPTGAGRALDGNITVRGTDSGNAGFVSFAGRGTGTALGPTIRAPGQNTGDAGQHPLVLGQGGNDTLTIEDGGTASLDLRIRSDQANHNGVFLDAQTVINPGGTLRFTQSMSNASAFAGMTNGNVGYHLVSNKITGQGTTGNDSTIDLFLPAADTNAANLALNGVSFSGTSVAVIVNGSGLGGLQVNGLSRPSKLLGATPDGSNADKIANLLTSARLLALTGSGGFLTPAAQGATFNFPAASEWTTGTAAANVGLRAANSNLTGVDVALPANSTWSHNLHVDAGAELGVNGVNVNAGTTSGLGALGAGAGGVRFNTGTVVAPGAAGVAGVLSVNGSATLAAGSTLRAEITGATNGTLRATDSLTITGSTLQFVPTNVTAGAHRWDVAVADGDANSVGSIVGKFGSAPLPADETTGSQRLWSLVYEPTRVSVGFTVGGDADYSGNTNFDDLLALAKHYNATGAQWIDGDFTRDGTVNFDDLLVLAKNYNRVAAGAVPDAVPGATADFNAAVASAFAAPVPEPTTLGLFGIGLLGMVGGRRRRRA